MIAIDDDPHEMPWSPATFGRPGDGPTPWAEAPSPTQHDLNDLDGLDAGGDALSAEARAAQVSLFAHLAEAEDPIEATRGARIADGAAARAAMAGIDAPKEWDEARATLDMLPLEPEVSEVAITPLAGAADDGVGSAADASVDVDPIEATRGARVADDAAARASMSAIDAPGDWEESRATLDPTIGDPGPTEIAMDPMILDPGAGSAPPEIAMDPMILDTGAGSAPSEIAMEPMILDPGAGGAPTEIAMDPMILETGAAPAETAMPSMDPGPSVAADGPAMAADDPISRMVHEAAAAGSDLSQFKGTPPPDLDREKLLAMMQ